MPKFQIKRLKNGSLEKVTIMLKGTPCPNCKKSIFEYYHEGKLCYTIPKTIIS